MENIKVRILISFIFTHKGENQVISMSMRVSSVQSVDRYALIAIEGTKENIRLICKMLKILFLYSSHDNSNLKHKENIRPTCKMMKIFLLYSSQDNSNCHVY